MPTTLGRGEGMETPDLRIDDIGDVLEPSESRFGRAAAHPRADLVRVSRAD